MIGYPEETSHVGRTLPRPGGKGNAESLEGQQARDARVQISEFLAF